MTLFDRYLIGAVIAHLVAVLVHTVSHLALQILPPPPDTVFILGVILIGPVLALPILRFNPSFAGALVAVLMAASFAYGFQSHFLAAGPDNVAIVGSEPWTLVFVVTGVLIGALELVTAVLGIAVFVQGARTPSESAGPQR